MTTTRVDKKWVSYRFEPQPDITAYEMALIFRG